MNELNIPKVEDLDPEQEDYVEVLEEGLQRSYDMCQAQHEKREELHKNLARRVKEEVEGVPGVYVKDDVEEEEREVNGEVRKYVERHLGLVIIGDGEEQRRVSDAVTELRRNYEDELRKVEDSVREARRRGIDYVDGLVDLTELKPLNKYAETEVRLGGEEPADPEEYKEPELLNLAEIYVCVGDEVYEIQCWEEENDEKLQKSELEKVQGVSPADFEDDDFLEEVRETTEEMEMLAYVVSNPSGLISPHLIIGAGIEKINSYRKRIMERVEEEKGPLGRLYEKVQDLLGGDTK